MAPHRVWLFLAPAVAHPRGFRQWCGGDELPVNLVFHLCPSVTSCKVGVSVQGPQLWGRSCNEKGHYCRRMESPILMGLGALLTLFWDKVACPWVMHREAVPLLHPKLPAACLWFPR